MPLPDLTYFTHVVEGRSFAGWFRTVSAGRVEVLGIGLLQTVAHPAHVAAANVARQTMAQFIKRRGGLPIPTVEQIRAHIN